jgi:hypothetical protein
MYQYIYIIGDIWMDRVLVIFWGYTTIVLYNCFIVISKKKKKFNWSLYQSLYVSIFLGLLSMYIYTYVCVAVYVYYISNNVISYVPNPLVIQQSYWLKMDRPLISVYLILHRSICRKITIFAIIWFVYRIAFIYLFIHSFISFIHSFIHTSIH